VALEDYRRLTLPPIEARELEARRTSGSTTRGMPRSSRKRPAHRYVQRRSLSVNRNLPAGGIELRIDRAVYLVDEPTKTYR
jgi:hypothetical protein